MPLLSELKKKSREGGEAINMALLPELESGAGILYSIAQSDCEARVLRHLRKERLVVTMRTKKVWML